MFKKTNKAKPDNNGVVKSTKNLVLNVIGIALCAILLPILILNCTLIIKGLVGDPKSVPSIGENIPLIVLTESMEDEINAGDLIICKKVDPQAIKEGDIISFFDPAGKGTSIVTHKVYKIYGEGSNRQFETYGVNNYTIGQNGEKIYSYDSHKVSVDDIVGIYDGTRIPGLGHVAMFMQSTWGLIICIGIPFILFVAYEVLRRRNQDMKKQADMDKLMAELEALKLAQANASVTVTNNANQETSNTTETSASVDKIEN